MDLSSFIFLDECSEAREYFDKGVERNSLFIFIQSGVTQILKKGDAAFEKEFDIHFYEEGCVGSMCSLNYNFMVFDHLNKRYGRGWIKKIRKDALGFNEWKQKRKIKS